MSAHPKVCQTAVKWLSTKKLNLAPLTGQDWRALQAFVHLVELYSVSDGVGATCALVGMKAAVQAMQPHLWHLAWESIAHVMDWHDRDRLWSKMGLVKSWIVKEILP